MMTNQYYQYDVSMAMTAYKLSKCNNMTIKINDKLMIEKQLLILINESNINV